MHFCEVAKRGGLVRGISDLCLMLSQGGDRLVLGPSDRGLQDARVQVRDTAMGRYHVLLSSSTDVGSPRV